MNAKVMRSLPTTLVLLSVLLPVGLRAEPRELRFGPPASEVAFRAYKLGLLPLDGNFQQFSGRLTYDPANHSSCRVELRVAADSLVTDEPLMRDTVAGPDFLNTARFPSLTYTGTCVGDEMDGALGMHGVSHPFALSLHWTGSRIQAEGRLLRAEWGMTALPGLAGRTIRIRVSIPLPATHAAARN